MADRIVVIEAGGIALDLPVNLPRPRNRSSEAFVNIREAVLEQVMNTESAYANKQLLQLSK